MNPADQKTATPEYSRSTPYEAIPFHAKSVESCLDILETRLTGLSDFEIETRRKKFGKNQVQSGQKDLARRLFFHQFKNLVIIFLFIAAALSFYTQQWVSGFTILGAMLINATISFMTQWKAQKAMLSLETFRDPLCTVIRDGIHVKIPAVELVPGDILMLSGGMKVPADARLITSDKIQVDESPLTGESVLVMKDAMALHIPDEDVTEQKNMVFAGSTIKTGSGQAIVVATGPHSMMGKIALLAITAARRDNHMTRGLNRLGMRMFILITVLSGVIIYMEYQHGAPLLDMIQLGIVLMVAAMPEVLPAVATFILSLGIERLSKENAIVRNLYAIEAIGSTTVICTDKTGTLTENALSVDRVYLPELGVLDYNPLWGQAQAVNYRALEEMLRVGRLNNTTILDGVRSFMMGDPIDVALFRATPAEYEFGYTRMKDYPFDSGTMLMSAVYKYADQQYASMIKGAPESVIGICNYYLKPDGQVVPLDKDNRIEFLLANQDLAMDGILRVIGFAEKPLKSPDEDPYQNAIFIGWVCLIDPPKQGMKQAIQQCQESGVRVMMITGDQKTTASIIARELGILDEHSEVWTRKDLDSGVDKIPSAVRVFARTQPEEKLAIVQSLQASGDIVAMVGDGVNDAPALRKSDIAIAMGIKGAEAAKESSDIILLNDRFETIAHAILEGRILTHNVILSTQYLMSCTLGLVIMMAASAFIDSHLPLNALQIIWLNIITVTLPALSLAFEPGTAALLKRPSHSYHQGIFTKEQLLLIGFWGFMMAAVGLGAFYTSTMIANQPMPVAMTLAFCTIAFSQTLHLLNIQMTNAGIAKKDFLAEISRVPLTWMIMGSAIALQLLTVYVPFFNDVLKTASFMPLFWLIPVGFSFLMMFLCTAMIRIETR